VKALCTLALALAACAKPAPTGVNLVVVIDRQVPAGQFQLVQDGARALLAAMGSTDRLGFIAAGDDVLTQSGSDELPRGRPQISAWLDTLKAATSDGQIGVGPPLEMAEGLLHLTESDTRAPRILIVSDGAHVAGFDNPDAKLRAHAMDLRKHGVRIDALSPGKPLQRPPLEALAELGGGQLKVMHLPGDFSLPK
jgi:hypothetical protein